jgi:hypothetical protein
LKDVVPQFFDMSGRHLACLQLVVIFTLGLDAVTPEIQKGNYQAEALQAEHEVEHRLNVKRDLLFWSNFCSPYVSRVYKHLLCKQYCA